jgi:hypothetical protein
MGAAQAEAGRLLCLRIALGVDESDCKLATISAAEFRELKISLSIVNRRQIPDFAGLPEPL